MADWSARMKANHRRFSVSEGGPVEYPAWWNINGRTVMLTPKPSSRAVAVVPRNIGKPRRMTAFGLER